jgi:hypothetical protein
LVNLTIEAADLHEVRMPNEQCLANIPQNGAPQRCISKNQLSFRVPKGYFQAVSSRRFQPTESLVVVSSNNDVGKGTPHKNELMILYSYQVDITFGLCYNNSEDELPKEVIICTLITWHTKLA